MTSKLTNITRKLGLLGSFLLLSCFSIGADEKPNERPVRPYRVIFNYDTSGVIGQGHNIIGAATTIEEFMEHSYGHALFADDSQVDAVF